MVVELDFAILLNMYLLYLCDALSLLWEPQITNVANLVSLPR
jgi:hypothetical protein